MRSAAAFSSAASASASCLAFRSAAALSAAALLAASTAVLDSPVGLVVVEGAGAGAMIVDPLLAARFAVISIFIGSFAVPEIR